MSRSPRANLSEGMRIGDLEDMVLPLISLDEYQSKITSGDEAIVLGLFVQDVQAADDLNRFIQKSAIDILDTERSPAPDQTGYFFVFVELPNNARLGDNIASILEEIGPLTGIEKWQVRLRGAKRIMPFDSEQIDRIFERKRRRSMKAEKRKDDREKAAESALPPSRLRDTSTPIIGEALARLGSYEIVDRGPIGSVLSRHRLDVAPISFKPRDIMECERIASALGEEIDVLPYDGEHITIRDDSEIVVLRRR